MWSLVVRCVELLDAESHCRRSLLVNLDLAADLGEETSESGEESSESGAETSVEGTTAADIELVDDVVLRIFRKLKPWLNKLTKLIKRSNKKIKKSNKKNKMSL